MTIKITNAIIIKNFDSSPFLGEIFIENDKIIAIEKAVDQPADKVIDAKQNIIMPGFVNANTTSFLSVLNGIIKGKKSQDFWAEINVLQKNLSKKDVENAVLYSILQYIKCGITTIGENSIMPDAVAEVCKNSGIRANLAIKQKYDSKKFLSNEELEKLYQNISSKSDLITAHFACNSVDFDLEERFEIAEKLSAKYQTFTSADASQTLEEVGRCATLNNDLTPVGLLEEYGFFDHDSLINYGTNLESKDIQIIKKYNSNVCVMPSTDYKLANGIVPLYQLNQYGINVCLGIGIGSSFGCFDMFSQLRQAVASQNTLISYSDSIDSRKLLKMATFGGAKSLNLKNVGTLEVGNQADLIMLDISDIILHNIFDSILYSCSCQNVKMTMVAGKILYDGKKTYLPKSEQTIIKNAKQVASKF